MGLFILPGLVAIGISCALVAGGRRICDLLAVGFVAALASMVVVGEVAGTLWHGFDADTLGIVISTVAAAGILACSVQPRLRRRVRRSLTTLRPRRPGAASPAAWVSRGVTGAVTLGMLAAYAVVAYTAIRLPMAGYDALYYHLEPIVSWIRHGWLAPAIGGSPAELAKAPFLVQIDSFPKNTEIVGAWLALGTGTFQSVALTQVVFAAGLAVGVYGTIVHLGGRPRWALFGASATALTPAVLVQAGALYTDVVRLATLALAAHLCLAAYPRGLQWAADRGARLPLLVAAGAGIGIGTGAKTLALLGTAAVGVWMLSAQLLAQVRHETVLIQREVADVWPRFRELLLYALIPAALTGGYWYVRAWIRLGSPIAPYSFGPFQNGVSLSDRIDPNLFDGAGSQPAAWLHGWVSGLTVHEEPIAGDQRYGTLGIIWIALGLPAILLMFRLARRYIRALVVVVVPVMATTFLTPGSYSTRYATAFVFAGILALCLLLSDASSVRLFRPAQGRRRAKRRLNPIALAWPVIAVVAMCSVLLDGWSGLRYSPWALYHYARVSGNAASLRELLDAADTPRVTTRYAEYGFDAYYDTTMSHIPSTDPIGFSASHAPTLTYGLAATSTHPYAHDLTILSSVDTPAGLVDAAEKAGVRYVFVSSADQAFLDSVTASHGLEPLGDVPDGRIFEVRGP